MHMHLELPGAQVHATIRILIIGNAPRLANTNIAPGPGWDGLPSSLQQCVQPQSWNTSGGWPGAGGLMETRSGSQHDSSAPRVATMLSRDSSLKIKLGQVLQVLSGKNLGELI